MKSARYFGYCLLGLLSFSSCSKAFELGIDICENAHIHEDGTGSLEIIVDFTKMKPLIEVVGYLGLVKKDDLNHIPTSARKIFRKTAKELESIPGIKDIATARDAKMLHFKLSFHFQDVIALNSAMHTIYANVDQSHMTYFEMDHHSFVRVDTQSISKLLNHYQAQDDSPITGFDLEAFFKDTTYKVVYSFDREIKKATKSAILSRDRKTFSFRQRIFDEQEKNKSFSTKVIF